MNYVYLPNLERLCLTRTVITLWNQEDIRNLIGSCPLSRPLAWMEVEEKVIEKVLRLLQPKPLNEKLIGFVKPVGYEIYKWLYYHSNPYLGVDLPNELCWSPRGTVDSKKTAAELLISDEKLDVTERYKLACIYCLEDDVRELWKRMKPCQKYHFYNEKDPRAVQQHELVFFWTYAIKGEIEKWHNLKENRRRSPYRCALELAVRAGNKAAIAYFLQKLTSFEREEDLVTFTSESVNLYRTWNNYEFIRQFSSEVLVFLLSEMNDEQQMKLLEGSQKSVLRWFLKWPCQDYFMQTVKRIWASLREDTFFNILAMIVSQIECGYKDYNYKSLFQEFWQQSPINLKKYVIVKSTEMQRHVMGFIGMEDGKGMLLSKLFKTEDKENIKLILNDASTVEREGIIFSDVGKDLCAKLINEDKSDLLKFFVRECLSGKGKIIQFKEEFKKYITCEGLEGKLEREKDVWRKLLQVLDDLTEKDDAKRSVEEENSNPAKKHFTLTCERPSTS